MIEVKNLVKMYGNHLAVDHLDFTIEQGKIYGFLGPNGAGKSTTMNIMTGYLGATEGEVIVNGHDILKEPELAKKSIGYLPEIPPLYPDMKVREYLDFCAELKKIHKNQIEDAVDEVVALIGLAEVEERLIKNLSKGYRQRVGLAQAVLGYPEIIILDEPMVGLDPKQIIEIRELIRELAKEHTIILSSHILAEIREVCDYILIISKGKLVASDTPENLEKLMTATETIKLEAVGSAEQIETILSGMKRKMTWEIQEKDDRHPVSEGEMAAQEEKQSSEPVCKVEIQVQEEEDLRKDVFFAFAKAKCPIISMSLVKASLEEAFLELTEGADETEDNPSENADEAKAADEETAEAVDFEDEAVDETENENLGEEADTDESDL